VKNSTKYNILNFAFLKNILSYFLTSKKHKQYFTIFFNSEIPCMINNINCTSLRKQYQKEYNELKKLKMCYTCWTNQLKEKYSQELLVFLDKQL
jgi:hypothetical protein